MAPSAKEKRAAPIVGTIHGISLSLISCIRQEGINSCTYRSQAISVQEQPSRPNHDGKKNRIKSHLRLIDPVVSSGKEQDRPIVERTAVD